jgi:crossover junction endodeoxyribonuclease RuvC
MMDSPTSIGIDTSLTGTAVALVGPEGFETFRFGRKGKREETLVDREARIKELVDEVYGVITDGMEWPKVAVLEYPSTMASGGSALDRNALWWDVFRLLRREEIPVYTPVTQQMKIYATGQGVKVDKEGVLVAMLKRHPNAPCRNNDEGDALALALMGARIIGEPLDGDLPKTHLRALDKMGPPA